MLEAPSYFDQIDDRRPNSREFTFSAIPAAGGDILTFAGPHDLNPAVLVVDLACDKDSCCGRARREERLSLARELHDRLGFHTSMLFLHLSRFGGERSSLDGRAGHWNLERQANMLESELRSILSELTTAPAAAVHFEDELRSMLRGLAEAIGCREELQLGNAFSRGVPNAVLLVAIRVAQEALNNIAKHAAGTRRVRVAVKRSQRHLNLTVENEGSSSNSDGPASPSRLRSGHGLGSMRERLLSVDGTLRAKRLPGGGFQIAARISLSPRRS